MRSSDLASPLRNGIGDHAGNANDPEEKSHPSDNRQDDEGKRGPRDRLVVELADRVHESKDRLPSVHRPDDVSRLLQQTLRSGPLGADRERRSAEDEFTGRRPGVDRSTQGVRELRRRYVNAVVEHVFHDAHHFAPGGDRVFAHALTERRTRPAPPRPRQYQTIATCRCS